MSNAWLVRPYPHNTNIKRINEFKINNIVAIGCPQLNDLTQKSREEIKTILSGSPYNYSGLELGNAYATVDIFVNRMQIGDYLLVPDGTDIYFAKITSDYYFDSYYANDTTGYPHQRHVEWLASCARQDLSKALRSSLKVHRTTADLTKHYMEIASLATGNTYDDSVNINAVNYPLREDFNISFDIPSDMTEVEAKRLSLFFETLYFRSGE